MSTSYTEWGILFINDSKICVLVELNVFYNKISLESETLSCVHFLKKVRGFNNAICRFTSVIAISIRSCAMTPSFVWNQILLLHPFYKELLIWK